MTTTATDHRLPRASLASILTWVLAAFMLLLAVRDAFDPIGAAHGFGADLAAPLDAFYLHVKADRDFAIAALLVGLVVYGRTTPLLIVVSALCVAPIVDCSLVAARGMVGYALGVHGSAAAFGLVLLALLARARRRPST